MATLIGRRRRPTPVAEERHSLFSFPDIHNWFSFNGQQYALSLLAQTYNANPQEEISTSLASFANMVYTANGPVFALEAVRMLVFSEARLMYRRLRDGRPGGLFSNTDLALLERPWPGGTTGDLLRQMILDADLAGNWFGTIDNGQIVRLRPDWVTIVLASRPSRLGHDLAGYLYKDGGPGSPVEPVVLMPDEVSHFAPYPDPLANYRGMSWLTPVVREIQSDSAATEHKKKFFENAATPNLAVTLDKAITPEQFLEFEEIFRTKYEGDLNAYKTLLLGGGADVTVVGADMKQLDFKATQGVGETRLAAAARIHPVVVGFSEGMQGSSLNAGNFQAARRSTADTCFRPLWRDAAGSLANITPTPGDAELWYDEHDIAFLRDDGQQEAAILKERMLTIESAIRAGYKADSAVEAVVNSDLSLLEHTGLFSVQLQPANQQQQQQPSTTE